MSLRAAIGLLLALGAAEARADSVLRIVPQASLQIFDPVWTTAQLTQMHGLMVYDQLFALDAKLAPKPQMVEAWTVDSDALTWRFTLRPGLKFSDGSPVRARDAVASLKRWAVRATDGQLLLQAVASIDAIDDAAFAIRLQRPFPPMLSVLANPTTPLFVMREQEASTDPFQQMKAVVGSGPFVFVAEEFREGSRAVYARNPYANPRPEPADGLAGGRVAKVDRVEWQVMPDPAVALGALGKGEVDLLENAPYDLLKVVERNPDLALSVIDPLGQQGIVRLNHLFPPFDDPKLRQAVLLAVDRQDYMSAMVGDPRFERPCLSAFVCGTPSESLVGAAPYAKPALEQAKRLVQESGYRGEPVVVLDPTEYAVIHAMTLVTVDRLKAIGLTVDIQAMTWSQLGQRRAVQDAPKDGRGGWHVIHTIVPGIAMASPVTNYLMATACDRKNWFGWPCDKALEALRVSYLGADTPAAQKAVFDGMQARYWEVVPFIGVGQILKAVAHRKSVTGLVQSPILALWNVEKR